MNFGEALVLLKDGKAVQRAGWNGKGMRVTLNEGSIDANGYDAEQFAANCVNGVDVQLFRCGDTGTITRMPNFVISNTQEVDGKFGGANSVWVPSTSDALADDWSEV